ncbi:right-handed parallel beta-helix repeat-containing protein [Dyadobacter sp. CY343]|uniref:right-handed parallel beta-helix repeat-containing protein n=1 Tax=Dyadobacter sp. CY343 TaxID=2907299 RepID=UPI001F4111E8|nr:right-handed parallel beta-helix repeat-containing protein [Dyadobacter sp. CY343]MCE7058628.1 right-handed parallel beta-helix repeat-containing protein [Dyadobacter sp. CY343]
MRISGIAALLAMTLTFGTSQVSFSQTSIKTITYSDTVKDYGPVITRAFEDLIKAGGGTLRIRYGIYPVRSAVVVKRKQDTPKITVTGLKNSKGKLPILRDTNSAVPPHHFFSFEGNIDNPTMVVKISNLEFVGNNKPYSKGHPFFGNENMIYKHAIGGINVKTMTIENVTIRNFYGRGILIGNYLGGKYTRKKRVESPVIRNCRIYNVWGYSKRDDSGDGIEFISVNKPTVENSTILNNLAQSKYIGRCGIVMERNTEKAIIRNNKIGGYARNIHVECDWGGHLIEKNNFSQSSIAVTLSEDCGQSIDLKDQFSPITIRNNTMVYNQEYHTYNIKRSPFSFISIHKPTFMLDGLQITGNKMTLLGVKKPVQAKQPIQAQNARVASEAVNTRYIDTKGQSNVKISGNSFN